MRILIAARSIGRFAAVVPAAMLALAACQIAPAPAPEATAQPTPVEVDSTPGVNRIAVIDRGGVIYTVEPDGGDRADLNASGAIPDAAIAWSPDNSRLAFSIVSGEGSQLVTVDPRGGLRKTIFRGSPAAAPFYLYWSPDSRHVAFLTSDVRGSMALRFAQAEQAESDEVIARGQPNYFSWSPKGERLALHIGGRQGFVGTYRLGDTETRQRDSEPALFQAPAWSPSGEAYLFARAGSSATDELVLVRDEIETTLAGYHGGITFGWSPDGARIAHSVLDASGQHYADLTLLDVRSGASRTLVNEPHRAFFWSPDGTRIAYLTSRLASPGVIGGVPNPSRRSTSGLAVQRLDQEDRVLELTWHVVEVESGNSAALASFAPTDNFLFVVPFFDQYAQSITLWSPDSRYLLLAGAPLGRESAIYRIDTVTDSDRLARIGSGEFAVWSWR
jgi:TolB protein